MHAATPIMVFLLSPCFVGKINNGYFRLILGFLIFAEDDSFEADKAQVMKEVAELEAKE